MPKASELTPDSRYFLLFAGPSGSGKKGAACSFQKLGPLRYLDFDMRFRGLLGSTWVPRDNIDYIPYPPISETLFFERLNTELENIYSEAVKGISKYKTLVIGSVTGEARSLLGDSHKITHKGENGKDRSISRNLGPLKIAGMENFRFINNATMQTLAFLQSLPMNVIVLAHTVPLFKLSDEDDPFSEKIEKGSKLALSDSLGALIPGLFDNVFVFDKEETGAGNSLKVKHTVSFYDALAKNIYGLKAKKHDITEKNFYDYFMQLTSKGELNGK